MTKLQVGIDLGTTNSLVAYQDKGKTRIFKFGNSTLLKSVLYYDGVEMYVGDIAKKKGLLNPRFMIKSSKTWMGENKKWIIADREFTPTDTAAEILQEIKNKLINKLKLSKDHIIESVITVPAYFTSSQIDETKKAGQKAGLNVKQIITEPVAAAIAYGANILNHEKIFVVDLGGGTFDVSILQASNSDKLYETLAIDGNKKLGGDDFDKAIFDIIVKHLNNKSGIDFATEETYVNSGLDDIEDYYCIRSILLEEAENAKLSLSEEDMCEISKANLFFYQGKYHNLELTISRDDFIKGMESNLTIIKQTIQRVFQNHTISKEEIDRVILVGGSCYIPAIRNIIKDFFGFEPYSDEDLSTLVVSGASLIANSDGIGIRINDIISHSLGIEVLAHNGKMELEKLLKKNDKYPCSNEKIFSTVSNNQEEVCINIWEGEIENDVNQNEFYGGFILDGIEKADAGVPKIKVKFDFDKSRILTVTAEDLSTKSKKEVIVKKGVHLSSVKAKPIDFTVLIDSSGSMRGREMELAKDACKKLVTNIIDLNTHKLALISFGDHAKIVSELTNNKEELIKRIETISSYGGTPMAEAFNLSNGILEISSNERISIVVTDGAPNNKQSVIKATNRAKQLAIRVIAIGVGSGVDSSYLKTITTSQNDYHYVDDMSSLEETFTSVINALQR